jgi:cyclophilin family peptidyl-prolyl cis-trans isomerase/protein-disulfide isomerase
MRIPSLLIVSLLLSACSAAVSAPAVSLPTEMTSYPPSSCTAVTAAADEQAADSPFPEVTAADWQRGPADASVTILEYSDFQCPFCAQLSAVLAELEARYPDDLRVVYRHFPLIGSLEQPLHEKAALSMQAAEAAGLQDRFWEMHDALFAAQNEWTGMSTDDFEAWLLDTAETLELDLDQFVADLHSEALETEAQAAWTHGQELGLPGTPFLLINGQPYESGPLDVNSLDGILQNGFLAERKFHECPPMELEVGANYTATLHTEKGDIVIELYPQVAPNAVNSFIFLAQHDWFDNVTFHRVLPGFVAQSGDPSSSGYGDPGYYFAIETDPDLLFDRAGLLAMANAGPTSNGSQFFITLGPAEHLNGQFTIFGEVIQGMEVAESLTPRDPSQSAGLPPGDLILDVIIEVH